MTPVGPGSATLYAQSGTVKGHATVKVLPTLISIAITPPSATLPASFSQSLTATGSYDNNTTKKLTSGITWATSNPAVATVSAAGLLEHRRSRHRHDHRLDQRRRPGSRHRLRDDHGRYGGGEERHGGAGVEELAEGSDPDADRDGGVHRRNQQTLPPQLVTWSSSAPSVASVSSSGVVTAAAIGTATISATPVGSTVTGTSKIKVTSATLVSVAVSPTNPTVIAGISEAFDATGTYSDGTTDDITTQVTWTSSVTTVATIASTGLASTLAPGSTAITATDPKTGKSGSTTLTVSAVTLASVAISPSTPTLPVGTALALTATGTLSNGTTENLSSSVSWSSSAPASRTCPARAS